MMCRAIILLCFVLFSGLYVNAATEQDSVRIYFQDGSSELDLSLRNNSEALDRFVVRYLSLAANRAYCIFSIYVESNASPSGSVTFNKKLSEERAATLLGYLRARLSLPDSLIRVVADGVDWDGLAAFVEKDTTVAGREAVIRILRHTSLWIFDDTGRVVNSRKKKLMDLQGGASYRMLNERYFADLRNVYIEIRYKKEEIKEVATLQSQDTAAVFEESTPKSVAGETIDGASPVQPVGESDSLQSDDAPLHRLAIKTNLLYDVLLMPSLEVEYRINDRWTVNLEGDIAWWKNEGKHKYYQLATISPEGRYWFKTRKPWHGHYLGLFGGFSWYDLENGKRGYKGEAVMTGVSYGYMFPIKGRLSLEAGIGVGYMHTWYEEYLPIDGHYVYQQSSKLNYFGPLKLKFALVWRLWDMNKKKGGAQ